jgi:phospholipase/carboxylesterase
MNDATLLTDLAVSAEIKLYYDVYKPENALPRSPLLIAVHGYGAHKRYMMREAQAVAPENFVIAAIEAPHPHFRKTDKGYRVGFGWLSDVRPEEHIALHQKFVLDVIEQLDDQGIIDPERIFIYGFSQACALNFRLALTYPQILRGIVGVCGGIPSDLESNATYRPFDAETLYLYTDDDEFYSQEQFHSYDQKLRALLPNYTSKNYDGKHEITDQMRLDIRDWLNKLI